MARIGIAGWQHETNTFAIKKADYVAFQSADEWPSMCVGSDLIEAVREVHLPVAGAIKALEESGHEIVPLLWCSATPCSYVTEDAFEAICNDILQRLKAALPLDGLYLDLHGAMVCEHLEDGEGEFLERVRQLVGDALPIFVSLDLHANVTPKMIEQASVIDIYRTYPHIDMGQTGYRVTQLLCDQLRSQSCNPEGLYKSFRQIPFLIPLNTGCTLISPCKDIYQALPKWITHKVPSLSFACGFHLSDIHDVGPSVVGYGVTQDHADEAVNKLVDLIISHQSDFKEKIWIAEAAMAEAKRIFDQYGKTIVLADTQDNPGGGGAGDTTGLLRAMIQYELKNALLGVINDSEVARKAHEIGIGGQIEVELGGKSGINEDQPLHAKAVVKNLSDGRFTATGPMYKGANMELGLCALLEISDVLVVVCSKAVQTADQAHFRHLGIEPGSMDYVAVKSSVHFRNDYDDIASKTLIVSAPGEVFADPGVLTYQNIRRDIEVTKMD